MVLFLNYTKCVEIVELQFQENLQEGIVNRKMTLGGGTWEGRGNPAGVPPYLTPSQVWEPAGFPTLIV